MKARHLPLLQDYPHLSPGKTGQWLQKAPMATKTISKHDFS
jgi:hypothetical protein